MKNQYFDGNNFKLQLPATDSLNKSLLPFQMNQLFYDDQGIQYSFDDKTQSGNQKVYSKLTQLEELQKTLSFSLTSQDSTQSFLAYLKISKPEVSPILVGKVIQIILQLLTSQPRGSSEICSAIRKYLMEVFTVRNRYFEETVSIFRKLFAMENEKTMSFFLNLITSTKIQIQGQFGFKLLNKLFCKFPEAQELEPNRQILLNLLLNLAQNEKNSLWIKKEAFSLLVDLIISQPEKVISEISKKVGKKLIIQITSSLTVKKIDKVFIDQMKSMLESKNREVYADYEDNSDATIEECIEIFSTSYDTKAKSPEASNKISLNSTQAQTELTKNSQMKDQSTQQQSNEFVQFKFEISSNSIGKGFQNNIKSQLINQQQQTLQQQNFEELMVPIKSTRCNQTVNSFFSNLIQQIAPTSESNKESNDNQLIEKMRSFSMFKIKEQVKVVELVNLRLKSGGIISPLIIDMVIAKITDFLNIKNNLAVQSTFDIINSLFERAVESQKKDISEKKYLSSIGICPSSNTKVVSLLQTLKGSLETILFSALKCVISGRDILQQKLQILFQSLFKIDEEIEHIVITCLYQSLYFPNKFIVQRALKIINFFQTQNYFLKHTFLLETILLKVSQISTYRQLNDHFLRYEALQILIQAAQTLGEVNMEVYTNQLCLYQQRLFQKCTQSARREKYSKDTFSKEEEKIVSQIKELLHQEEVSQQLQEMIKHKSYENSSQMRINNASSSQLPEFVQVMQIQIQHHRCGNAHNQWWVDFVKIFSHLLLDSKIKRESLLLLNVLIKQFSVSQIQSLFDLVFSLSSCNLKEYTEQEIVSVLGELITQKGINLFFSSIKSALAEKQAIEITIRAMNLLTMKLDLIDDNLLEEVMVDAINLLSSDQHILNNTIYQFLAAVQIQRSENKMEQIAELLYFSPPHLYRKVSAYKNKLIYLMNLQNSALLYGNEHDISKIERQEANSMIPDQKHDERSVISVGDESEGFSFIGSEDEI